MPKRVQARGPPPGDSLVKITPANRVNQLERARNWLPPRPADRLDYWRRYVQHHWKSTLLDDDDALLVGHAGGRALLAALPPIRKWLTAALRVKFPSTDLARRALAREEGRPALRVTLEVKTPPELEAQVKGKSLLEMRMKVLRPFMEQLFDESDEIARRLAHLQQQVKKRRDVLDAIRARSVSYPAARAAAVHRLRTFLTARDPKHRDPPWEITTAFAWRVGWNVDPHDPRSRRALMVEYYRRYPRRRR